MSLRLRDCPWKRPAGFDVLPEDERRRVYAQARKRMFGHWQTWAAMLVFVGLLVVFVVTAVRWDLGAGLGQMGPILVGALAGAVGGVIFSVVTRPITNYHIREQIGESPSRKLPASDSSGKLDPMDPDNT